MTLKRFCDNCKEQAKNEYGFLNDCKNETMDLCSKCEKVAKIALKKRYRAEK